MKKRKLLGKNVVTDEACICKLGWMPEDVKGKVVKARGTIVEIEWQMPAAVFMLRGVKPTGKKALLVPDPEKFGCFRISFSGEHSGTDVGIPWLGDVTITLRHHRNDTKEWVVNSTPTKT